MGKLTIVWVSIVVGAITAWSLAGSLGALNLTAVTPASVGTVLTSLIFVALLIERAVEVFVSPITADDKQNLVGEQNKVRTAIDDLKALLAPQPTVANPSPPQPEAAQAEAYTTRIGDLQKIDQTLTIRINALDKQTQKLALSFSVPISFVVALAGARALGPFLIDSTGGKVTQLSNNQSAIFAAADVVLTAGLLAGGADGIHKILDRFIKLAAGKDVQSSS